MKKIVCISLCVLLLVPLLAISVFAEDDSVSFSIVNNTGHLVSLYINSSLVDAISSGSSYSCSVADVDLALQAYTSYNGGFYYRFYLDSSGTSLVSNNSSNPTIINPDDVIYLIDSGSSSSLNYYVRLVSPVPPDPFAPVNDGVSSSINFAGQVLHFISTNADILALVGLAVALGFAIPCGVSKLKDLIKGY